MTDVILVAAFVLTLPYITAALICGFLKLITSVSPEEDE